MILKKKKENNIIIARLATAAVTALTFWDYDTSGFRGEGGGEIIILYIH